MRRGVVALAFAFALAAGCVPMWKDAPHDELFQRTPPPQLHRIPEVIESSDWWDHALQSTALPLARTLSPAQAIDWLTDGRPALDVNAFGQVPDSPWFVNRINRAPMTARELANGPNRAGAPAPGPLLIISGKPEGVMPGLVLRDTDGVTWFVKFDPPAFPELSSGAEMIASRILYAAGYWVPETYVVDLELARLVLSPTATTSGEYDREIALDESELMALLTQLNPDPRGRLRALFSRAVPGRPIGPFAYRGVRPDDPNDRIPHERRRSLRGSWVFHAWLNNTDTRRQNTLDTFIPVGPDGLGYVRHYLLDFGDSLGAAGDREKYVYEGYEGAVDWSAIGKRLAAAGLLYPYWLRVQRSPHRSVGVFEADVFEPGRWRPIYGNPAFDEATAHDTFWAAAILARFDEAAVRAAVSTARYSNEGATDYVVRTLMKRRRELLRYAFSEMAPLDAPEVVDDYVVRLIDLEQVAGMVQGQRRYEWQLIWDGAGTDDRVLGGGVASEPAFDLRPAIRRVMTDEPEAFADDPFVTLRVGVDDREPLRVHLRAVRTWLLPVGITRRD